MGVAVNDRKVTNCIMNVTCAQFPSTGTTYTPSLPQIGQSKATSRQSTAELDLNVNVWEHVTPICRSKVKCRSNSYNKCG